MSYSVFEVCSRKLDFCHLSATKRINQIHILLSAFPALIQNVEIDHAKVFLQRFRSKRQAGPTV